MHVFVTWSFMTYDNMSEYNSVIEMLICILGTLHE